MQFIQDYLLIKKIANMQMLVGIEGRKSCVLQGPYTQQGQRLNTTALCFQDTAGEEVHYLQQLVGRALGGPTSTRTRTEEHGRASAREGVRHRPICAKEGMQTQEPNKTFGMKCKYLQERTNPSASASHYSHREGHCWLLDKKGKTQAWK